MGVKKIRQSEGTSCGGGFDENGFIRCSGVIDFLMNNKSLRYIAGHIYVYIIKPKWSVNKIEKIFLKRNQTLFRVYRLDLYSH